MTDTKIGPNIRPIAEPRTSDKPARKEPTAGQEFGKELEQAVHALNKINQQPVATSAVNDAKSIQDAAAAEQARFESAMRQADRLRQLHQTITQKPTPDKH